MKAVEAMKEIIPTHQISFHTLSALNCLIFERSDIIYDKERTK